MDNISPKIQNQLAMLQQMQQQMQTVVSQKAQYEMAIKEAKRALEELSEVADDAPVYQSVGSVIMQKEKGKVVESLSDRVDTLEIRIKSIEKQEKALSAKFEQMSGEVKAALEKKPPNAT